MKTKRQRLLVALMTLSAVHHAAAQGTAFAYQGQLQNNGSPVSGTYDFTFSLYNAASGGTAVAGPEHTNGVVVTSGLFLVTLDFGASVWNGATNWLQIGVATNGSTPLTYLAPLQQITPVPQAIFATSASNLLGTLAVSQLNGTVSLTQLPATVVTQTEAAVTLGNLTVNGLELPNPMLITSDFGSLLYSDQSGNFTGGHFSHVGTGSGTDFGSENTVIGSYAGVATGSNDTVVGYYANGGGSYNTAVGWEAMYFASGNYNTAAGYDALSGHGSGNYNVCLGVNAGGNYNSTESDNIDIGYAGSAGENKIIHLGNDQTDTYLTGNLHATGGNLFLPSAQATVFAGTSPLFYYNENNNFFGGVNAGLEIGSGANNTGVGASALRSITSGSGNSAFGEDALNSDNSGSNNVAMGFGALAFNQTGYGNTALGFDALALSGAGVNNTAIGENALVSASGGGNTAVGGAALEYNGASYNNTAVGYQSLSATGGPGIDNVAVGVNALYSSTGGQNTSIGTYALQGFSSGSGNIALGYSAGQSLSSGNNNIYIGSPGSATESGIIRIGTPGTHTATYLAGTAYCQILGITSDRNAKENFAAINPRDVLAKVATLPVTEWNYKTDRQDQQHIGPMAQDFQAAFGLNGADDTHISVVDEGGVALAAIQGLNQKLEQANAELKRQNDWLAKRLNNLEQTMQSLREKK